MGSERHHSFVVDAGESAAGISLDGVEFVAAGALLTFVGFSGELLPLCLISGSNFQSGWGTSVIA